MILFEDVMQHVVVWVACNAIIAYVAYKTEHRLIRRICFVANWILDVLILVLGYGLIAGSKIVVNACWCAMSMSLSFVVISAILRDSIWRRNKEDDQAK